ncbi:YesL family protein [Radiobacillus sp. PE A8.2]|uniref:YesL family protein n=1 Tax=Radiobacillus sp. PE A8.2 TaxID=3380349 RepID=UPI0038910FB9
MQFTGWAGTFYRISDWVFKLAYVNILWMCFTLIGLVLFGFFPATTAMFALIRKWLMGEEDLPVFKTFWSYYKKEFKKSNKLGFVVVIIGLILYVDLQIIPTGSLPFVILKWLLMALLVVFLIMLIYMFPIYVHFDFPFAQYIKYPILMSIVAPLQTVLLLISSYLVYLIMMTVPGLIPFFGGSALCFVWTWIILNYLHRVQQKQFEKEEEKEMKAKD